MNCSHNSVGYDRLYLIVDSDACIVDTNTVIVNVLGTVVNIQRNVLRSPWNSSINAGNSHREQGTAVKLEVDSTHPNEGRRCTNASLGCSGNLVTEGISAPKDHTSDAREHIGESQIVYTGCNGINECPVTAPSTQTFVKARHQRNLQELVQIIRQGSERSKQVIQEALETADEVIQQAEQNGYKQVESFTQIFENSCVSYIIGNPVNQCLEIVSDGNALKIKPLNSFVEEIAVASYQPKEELDFLQDTTEIIQRITSLSGINGKQCETAVVFISQLPGVVRKLITIAGTKDIIGVNVSVEVAHREDIGAYLGYQSTSNCVLYPAESGVVQQLHRQLEKAGVNRVSVIPQETVVRGGSDCISKTTADKVDLLKEPNPESLSKFSAAYLSFTKPVIIKGVVVKGFGRGASSLGIPTANLECDTIPHLVPGVYFGACKLSGNKEVEEDTPLKTILSVGFNPHFDHATYSIEPYIYHCFKHTLLGQHLELFIQGFLRTEARFESLQHLIAAIQRDLLEHKLITIVKDGCH
ncbi:riboflavin kinase FAD synthetase domain containing protein [Babesia ovis]|uniref:riboflavin kinase n=1 Tax=Babesia ovis TaxID=5869 RepID=A0A9W5TDB1_BABOV|nr:riboflavin kinase FAD synthetase domain containing protein [Babesia ovis]